MANCQAGRRAGGQRGKEASWLPVNQLHRAPRRPATWANRDTQTPGEMVFGEWETLLTGGGAGGAGKPSVSWVHSVPITLPLIPCFLSRDNIDDFCVCVSAQGSIDGADRFSNSWNLSGISSAGPLSLRDFSASCCTIGSPGHVLSSE